MIYPRIFELRKIKKIYYPWQCSARSGSIKHSTTITEVVVVWRLCSVCKCDQIKGSDSLQHFTLFAKATARCREISVNFHTIYGHLKSIFHIIAFDTLAPRVY